MSLGTCACVIALVFFTVCASSVPRQMDYRRTTRRGDAMRRLKQDRSLMTYRGHEVYRTLLRAHLSPLETTGGRYVVAGSNDGTVYM
jgi:hypothetical protein